MIVIETGNWKEYHRMADEDFSVGDVFLVRTRERMILDGILKEMADAFAVGYLAVMAKHGATPDNYVP